MHAKPSTNARREPRPWPSPIFPKVLAARVGQPQELAGAQDVIRIVKRSFFDASPEGRLSWIELERFIKSDGRDRK